jgi:hypothetical protein
LELVLRITILLTETRSRHLPDTEVLVLSARLTHL